MNMIRRMWIVVGMVALGCASARTPKKPVSPESQTTSKPSLAPSRQITLGESVKGEPITLRIFGDENAPVIFIMGGIHGDETTGVDLTTNLIATLEQNPGYVTGKCVAILRVANPDG